MKTLITGAAGYIGSHTTIELLKQTGFTIISADNYCNSSSDTFQRIQEITGTQIKNYPVDLCNAKDTKKIFEENPDIDGVIHFAALKAVGESVEKPLLYYRNNINSLLNLLECCREYGVNNFIFSSSCSVYGNISELPVTENTSLNKAESPYAYTKQIGERIIEDFCKVNPDFNAIALRYFNPVGAHPSGLNGELPINKPNNLVPVVTQTAAGIMKEMKVHGSDYNTRDGSCIRDYIHVCDIADAHVKALQFLIDQKNETNYDLFNLGSGNGVSVLEAIYAFEKVTGVKVHYEKGPRRPGDVEAIYSDSSKAKKTLGWETQYNINDMMESAWKWQQHLLQQKP